MLQSNPSTIVLLDKLIQDKVNQISYTQAEMANISDTLANIKSIVSQEPDFDSPFLGGSYKRKTMVKGVSDVDVYFRYRGTGNPQSALDKLKKRLIENYPMSEVKQDKPSILANFKKIPINITPVKQDNWGNLSIPDPSLLYWKEVKFGALEAAIADLRLRDINYIDLIKILKWWNQDKHYKIKNYQLEEKVCNLFLYGFTHSTSKSISDRIWTFFTNNGLQNEAKNFQALMLKDNNDPSLNTQWLNFIKK